MHTDVARQAFHLFGQLQQCGHVFFIPLTFRQQRLGIARHDGVCIKLAFGPGQRDPLARRKRNQLRHTVNKGVRHVEHATAVAHRRLRRHRAKRCDLANTISAVFVAHVTDHPITAFLTKIDIEVGHRHPLRIQKSLEQQVVFQRIKIGDAERIGHQRTRPGATTRPHRHTIIFRPRDEIRHDQKVTGEAHLQDHADLKLAARDVTCALGIALRRIGIQHQQTLLKPRHHLVVHVRLDGHTFR